MSLSEISFELTNACNLKCIHCIRQTAEMGNFPMDVFERILVDARVFETPHIILTGGEPTLHPHLKEAIDIIVDNDYTYNIVTNGWNFERVMDITGSRLKRKKNLTGISLSIDGARAETHDAIRGEGSFRELMKAVTIIKANHIRFAFLMTLNAINRDEMEDTAKLSMKIGAKCIFLTHMFPTRKTVEAGIVLNPQGWREVEAEAAEIKSFSKHEVHMTMGAYTPLKMFQCRTLSLSNPNFDYKGRLTFCCLLSGYREERATAPTEIIADMAKTNLFDALKRWMDRVHEYNLEKLEYIKNKKWTDLDYFPCYYCQKHFGKMRWLGDYPDSPWAESITEERHPSKSKQAAAAGGK
ncbi:MAG TPA: radical SAM protein [bacterium]